MEFDDPFLKHKGNIDEDAMKDDNEDEDADGGESITILSTISRDTRTPIR
jgi:hypothetical protein